MEILTHQYNSFEFGQLAEDSTIGGKRVPKGYVNATAMCKANGKRLNNWTRSERAKAYLEALSCETQIRVSQLAITIDINGQSGLQGTWTHPDVAISIASWISPQFEVWANRVIRLVLLDQFTPKTADAAIAQTQLKDKLERIMDLPDPWRRFYDKEFCDRVFNWFGAQFYWTYIYSQFTPEEACKINTLNPPVNGVRPDKIHQYINPEIKERLKPYIGKLTALADGAPTREDFILGYARHFGGNDQLRLFK